MRNLCFKIFSLLKQTNSIVLYMACEPPVNFKGGAILDVVNTLTADFLRLLINFEVLQTLNE